MLEIGSTAPSVFDEAVFAGWFDIVGIVGGGGGGLGSGVVGGGGLGGGIV